MSHREEASGKTQDTLEKLCLSAGLGTPRGPPGRAGGSVWGAGLFLLSGWAQGEQANRDDAERSRQFQHYAYWQRPGSRPERERRKDKEKGRKGGTRNVFDTTKFKNINSNQKRPDKQGCRLAGCRLPPPRSTRGRRQLRGRAANRSTVAVTLVERLAGLLHATQPTFRAPDPGWSLVPHHISPLLS
ncbi:hypothetical protein L3Q82_002740 [Scortum barcoo]|uniref:Uncharacterized protein n=1 Tax=Scortum barcoo TaxID=214431 RepID=A0ACB8VUM9_9TELE|nr:hypothetical protein L3Q82_002740 [Scortum barcoo]